MADRESLTHGRIQDLYSKAHASGERLDYFMCTAAGALFAYIGQSFAPEKLPFASSLCLCIALLILTISFVCGYFRLQSGNAVTRWNQKQIQFEDELAEAIQIISECGKNQTANDKSVCRSSLGKTFTLAEMKQKKYDTEIAVKSAEKSLQRGRSYGNRFAKIRDICLSVSFVFILAAKVFQWLVVAKHP